MEIHSVCNISNSNKIALREVANKIGASLDKTTLILSKTNDKETINTINEIRGSLIIYSQFIFELIENAQKNTIRISDFNNEILEINETCKKIMLIKIGE